LYYGVSAVWPNTSQQRRGGLKITDYRATVPLLCSSSYNKSDTLFSKMTQIMSILLLHQQAALSDAGRQSSHNCSVSGEWLVEWMAQIQLGRYFGQELQQKTFYSQHTRAEHSASASTMIQEVRVRQQCIHTMTAPSRGTPCNINILYRLKVLLVPG